LCEVFRSINKMGWFVRHCLVQNKAFALIGGIVMGQLVIKYKTSGDPGIRELNLSIGLSRSELKSVKGLPIQEFLIDGEVFVSKQAQGAEDEDSRGD